jgi:type IV secretory pathway VirB10-like protein
VNNMPLFLVLAALGVFLTVMVLVAVDRAAKQKESTKAVVEKGGGDASQAAKVIIGDRQDGMVKATPLAVPDMPTVQPLSMEGAIPPPGFDAPPPAGASSLPEHDEKAEQLRQIKLARLEEAVRAKTRVQTDAPRSGSSPIGSAGAPSTREEALARIAAVQQQANSALSSDPTAAYRARVAQLQAAGLVPTVGVGDSSASSLLTSAGRANDLGQFNSTGGDRWRLDSKTQEPRSRYELRAGFVIPATLISGINSDLPGQIVAQVSQDVFDTATGNFKLVPQGSRLVGAYSSNVAYGQSRVLVAWQRIVFPDGKALDIGSMPGADGAGYAGFSDEANNHYVRIFSSALMMSGVVAGVAYSQRAQSSSAAPTAGSALSEALGQQLGQVTAQMISKNLNIAPTLEIRPGFRFNVIVVKDLTFSKPYAAFDY